VILTATGISVSALIIVIINIVTWRSYREMTSVQFISQVDKKKYEIEARKYKVIALCALVLLFVLFVLFSIGIVRIWRDSSRQYVYDSEHVTNDSPIVVAIILGRHKNTVEIPDTVYREIERYLERAVNGGYVYLIIADGSPTIRDIIEITPMYHVENVNHNYENGNFIHVSVEALITRIMDVNITAEIPQTNLLAAIREARSALTASSFAHIPNRYIVIVTTGLSTAGDLNLLNHDLQETRLSVGGIVDPLIDQGILPDLTGINVTFIGFENGMAAVYPQQLSSIQSRFVHNLWNTVVRTSGACIVRFHDVPGWGNTPYVPISYQPVSTVHFLDELSNETNATPYSP